MRRSEPHRFDRCEVDDLGAVHELGGQHRAGGSLGHDARHADEPIPGEAARDARDVLRLAPEVQLLADHLADLGMVRLHPAHAREELDDGQNAPDRLEILGRDAFDVGVLHFDRDASAVRHPRLVHLGERRRGERLALERREHRIRLAAELGADARDDLVERSRGKPVLQSLELRPEIRREHVREDADQLPDLDEQPAGADDRVANPARVDAVLRLEQLDVPRRIDERASGPKQEVAGEHARRGAVDSNEAEASASHVA